MILVFGATGTVGGEVRRQLRTAGAAARGAYTSEAKAAAARQQGFDAVVADLGDPASLRKAMQGVDKLFLVGQGAQQLEHETNAVRAAKEAGVRHIVKLSVWGADEEAFSFAKLHRAAERALEQSGLQWTFLRPNGFMQNTITYMPTIKSEGTIYQPAAEARVAHVDVRDLAAVAVKALTEPGHEGKAYTLSGPEALTYHEVAAKIGQATGKSVKYVALPDEAFKQAMVGAGAPAPYADAYLDLNRYYRTGSASRITDDIQRILGRPPHSFDDFARDHAAAW